MATTVKINLDSTEKILLKRNLDKNGAGQRFFTSEVRRMSDGLVPMDTGVLKNNVSLTADTITYNSIYARRQYYEHKGKGQRGRLWIPRTWGNYGKEITESVARFCGGVAK